jgi:hypothetical protein
MSVLYEYTVKAAEAFMKVELAIDINEELPSGKGPSLVKNLLNRLQKHFNQCNLVKHYAGSDGLSLYGGEKVVNKKVEEILQQTRESADSWFY